MSISQSHHYPVPFDPDCRNPHSKPSRNLHERRQNKKRKLEAKRAVKQTHNAPYTPFFVPEDLLEDDDKYAQRQSAFLSLPNELILLVVEHLSIPYFQVSLGLSCKRVASILAQNRIRIAPWRGYLDKEGLYRLLTRSERRPSITSQPPSKQRQLSLDGLSISSPSTKIPALSPPYIPTNLRLCRACFRHVPRDPVYWQRKMRDKEYDAPGVNWFDITNFFEEGFRNCGQHKCPDCCVKGYMAFMNEGKYEAALKEDLRDEGWGIDLDGEHGGRRVSPELRWRISRP